MPGGDGATATMTVDSAAISKGLSDANAKAVKELGKADIEELGE